MGSVFVLGEDGYEVIGRYQPGGNSNFSVVVFTSDKIKSFCLSAKGKGMLAAAMKVGLELKDGVINVSILNPEYLFYAYFRDKMDNSSFKSSALAISSDIKTTMKGVGALQKPFGGDLTAQDLMKYHYMAGMPRFDKPVKLADFENFQQGVALLDKEEGEAHFLPIIGESHVAAMPYEIILTGNKTTMLHGRYRFALHWPELTMKTFTKIMSSPGDVEDAMKALVD